MSHNLRSESFVLVVRAVESKFKSQTIDRLIKVRIECSEAIELSIGSVSVEPKDGLIEKVVDISVGLSDNSQQSNSESSLHLIYRTRDRRISENRFVVCYGRRVRSRCQTTKGKRFFVVLLAFIAFIALIDWRITLIHIRLRYERRVRRQNKCCAIRLCLCWPLLANKSRHSLYKLSIFTITIFFGQILTQ